MKYFLLIFSLNSFSTTYESTDNKSMSKFERINVNEQRVIEMSKTFQKQKGQIEALKNQFSQLEKRVKELETAPKTQLSE